MEEIKLNQEHSEHSTQFLTFKLASVTRYKYYVNDTLQQGNLIKRDKTYEFIIKYIKNELRPVVREMLDRGDTFIVDVNNQDIFPLKYDQTIDEELAKIGVINSAVASAKTEAAYSDRNLGKIKKQDEVNKLLDLTLPRDYNYNEIGDEKER